MYVVVLLRNVRKVVESDNRRWTIILGMLTQAYAKIELIVLLRVTLVINCRIN